MAAETPSAGLEAPTLGEDPFNLGEALRTPHFEDHEMTLGELAERYHEHPDLPEGRLRNGCWKCVGCGKIVRKKSRWLNWCSDCGYDEWD